MSPWDPSDYPAEWPTIRDDVLRRSGACCQDAYDPPGGVCEFCGATNHEPHPKTGSTVILTIAHVYDRRPHATSLDNLRALCQRCHNRLDSSMRRRPPGAKATGIGTQQLLPVTSGGGMHHQGEGPTNETGQ